VDAPRSFERGGNEEFDEGKHLLGVWKGKDRLASETPQIVAWDHVATEPHQENDAPLKMSEAYLSLLKSLSPLNLLVT